MSKVKTMNDAQNLDMDTMYTISGFPNYKINRRGKVINSRGLVLKHHVNEKGYRYVVLKSEAGTFKSVKVHRLVASQFILKNGRNKNIVTFIDGDKSNTAISNLKWADRPIRKKARVSLTDTQRMNLIVAVNKYYKTLSKSEVYDRLEKKYNVSRDYLSTLNYSVK